MLVHKPTLILYTVHDRNIYFIDLLLEVGNKVVFTIIDLLLEVGYKVVFTFIDLLLEVGNKVVLTFIDLLLEVGNSCFYLHRFTFGSRQ